jgi:hypothetical protein
MLSRASVPRHAIIKKLAGEDIANLDDLIAVLSKLARGSRVPLEYVKYTDRHRNKVRFLNSRFITINNSLSPAHPCTNLILSFLLN